MGEDQSRGSSCQPDTLPSIWPYLRGIPMGAEAPALQGYGDTLAPQGTHCRVQTAVSSLQNGRGIPYPGQTRRRPKVRRY